MIHNALKFAIKTKCLFYRILQLFAQKELIIDPSGTLLTPGNGGKNCRGNGNYKNIFGKTIECCCDECDYLMACINKNIPQNTFDKNNA